MTETDSNHVRVLSFTDHLEELRGRIIICVSFFVLAFCVSLYYSPGVVSWLMKPLTKLYPAPVGQSVLRLRLDESGFVRFAGLSNSDHTTTAISVLTTTTLAAVAHDRVRLELPFGYAPIETASAAKSESQLYYLSPIEPIVLLIKAALLTSLAVSLPMIIYQIWLFIAPGLLMRERRIVKGLLLSSLLLFPIGALFAYFISSVCLKFLLAFGDQIPGLTANIVASKYVGFIMGLMLIFGILFEFPIVLLLLARLGVVTAAFLVRKRRMSILILSIVAAIGTPSPDPFSMIALFIPLLILYEGSIWAIRLLERGELTAAAAAKENSV